MLDGKVCLVTGGARGMGREAAVEMARQGAAAVAIVDIADGPGAEAVAQVRKEGSDAIFLHCDLAERDDMASVIEQTVAEFGGLDVLHNNAAVIERAFTNDVDFDVLPEHLWDLVMNVNVKAVWLMSRFAAPFLRKSTLGPSIINAASVAGRVAYSHAVYGVSKAAVIQLTRSMAMSLAPDVRVNCYCPGTIDTDMSASARAAEEADPRVAQITTANLVPRLGTPSEVAKLVCFLASGDAGFITGAAYDIDGGALAWRGHR